MDQRSECISVLLKRGTQAIHEQLERTPQAACLARGELDQWEYVRLLMMLWQIYRTMEEELEKLYLNLHFTGIRDLNQLIRAWRLSSDLAAILDVPSWQSHPSFRVLTAHPPVALTNYLDRLQEVAATHPRLLLAHAYVRYLGDMSGGQYIKRKVQKAYGLADSQVQFYLFGPENGGPTLQQMKDRFRQDLDGSVANADIDFKEQLVNEARIAFQLNLNLFRELKLPSSNLPPDDGPLKSQLSPSAFSSKGFLSQLISTSIHYATKLHQFSQDHQALSIAKKMFPFLLLMIAAHTLFRSGTAYLETAAGRILTSRGSPEAR